MERCQDKEKGVWASKGNKLRESKCMRKVNGR